MTAPVIQERNDELWNVSFVMPEGMNAQDLPQPSSGDLLITDVPQHLAVATTWSGTWKYDEVEKRGQAMINQLAGLGTGLTANHVGLATTRPGSHGSCGAMKLLSRSR